MAGTNKRFDAKLGASLSKLGLSKKGSGTSPGPARLPSLKPSRDLTLGTQKRTFVPNIPARPHAKDEKKDQQQPGPSSQKGSKQHERNKDSPGGRGRGKGRGRGRGEIVTAASIFSHGPAFQQKHPGASAYGSKSTGEARSAGSSVKSKDLEDTEDSKEFMEMLQEEGRMNLEGMSSTDVVPIILPLLSTKLSKKEDEEDGDLDADVDMTSIEKDVEMALPTTLHAENRKPIVKAAAEEHRDVTAAELFGKPQQEERLLFFQFPDVLPIKPITAANTPEEPSGSDDSSSIQDKSTETSSKIGDQFSLKNVSEGYVGKLQIHKSGKVKLVLGNAKLDVSMGIPCGFLQDLVSINKTDEKADMSCLGHVSHRILCTPDYEALLGSTEVR